MTKLELTADVGGGLLSSAELDLLSACSATFSVPAQLNCTSAHALSSSMRKFKNFREILELEEFFISKIEKSFAFC